MSPRLKALLRAPLFTACEWLWSAGFSLAGFVDRQPIRRWASRGGEHVLVVAPHPDDECAGCCGTIVLHTRAGDHVTLVQVTDGRASRAGGYDGEAMAQVRLHEGRTASALLGIQELIQFALPEGAWRESELCERLREILMELNPAVIYTTSCIDIHPEHLRVARALAAVLDAVPGARVRVYEVTVPLTPRLVNCVADTLAAIETQKAVLAAYPSQALALMAVARMQRYRASYYRSGHADVFWEMRPRQFQRLMQVGDWLGEQKWSPTLVPFRSMLPRPFTDPLAYWRGAATRKRLKKPVEGDL